MRVYFDGGLPFSKRSTRLDRLEKSRQQLQVSHIAHPILDLRSVGSSQEQQDLNDALWRLGKLTYAFTQLPFIVPAAKEHLIHSEWSKTIFTVPGEADSFCAAAAKASGAVVLTNDSDLVLFDDMQDEGVVMLLNSLMKTSNSEPSDPELIRGRCWRPAEIRRQLGVNSVAHLGFERSEDASCSFPIIIQRAKALSSNDSTSKFSAFVEQFQSTSNENSLVDLTNGVTSQVLEAFDPRLAELVVQFEQVSGVPEDLDFHVYFPILHEDLTRDASWSYGRSYRQLAYSILYQNSILRRRIVGGTSVDAFVTEFIRKGQRIAKENVHVLNSQELLYAARQEIDAIKSFALFMTAGTEERIATAYLLHGLLSLLSHRSTNGKQQFPSILVAQLVGLTPIQSMTTKTFRVQPSSTYSDGWALLHLNANVQAVLYSIRMLKQSVDSVIHHSTDNKQQQLDDLHVKSSHISAEIMTELHELQQLLSIMPPIQAMFLNPADVAVCMQSMPKIEFKTQVGGLFKKLGVDLSAYLPPDESLDNLGSGDVDAGAFEEVTKKKKKKQKAAMMNQNPSQSQNKAVRNMFDLLQRNG